MNDLKPVTKLFYAFGIVQLIISLIFSFDGFIELSNLCTALGVLGIALGNWTRIRDLE